MKVLNFKEMESYWGKDNKSKFFVFALLFIMNVTGFYACKKKPIHAITSEYYTSFNIKFNYHEYKNFVCCMELLFSCRNTFKDYA